ncbi:MAG: retroviral-like aspartic protease family protein [Chloroflexi bacterium]|nr:retroviral-like aspartic protease family protein [Chloroflexota bacterium]
MIRGTFDSRGRPYVQGRLFIPGLKVTGNVDFLVDTGADRSALHPRDGTRLNLPYDQLQQSIDIGGVGGNSRYFVERAYLFFVDGRKLRVYRIGIAIPRPRQNIAMLPSLLGRDVIDNWWMRYDPLGSRLEFTVKRADITLWRT